MSEIVKDQAGQEEVVMDDARAALYAQFTGQAAPLPVIEEKPVEPPKPKPDAPTEIKEPAGPTPDKKEETPPAPLKEETEKEPEDKKVPLSALHEERSRRKLLAEKLKISDEKEKMLLDDIRKQGERIESLEKKKIQEEPIDDVEGVIIGQKQEISTLKKRIESIESQATTRAKMEEVTQAQAKEQEILRQVETVDQALSQEGFPGFKNLASEVAREVMARVQEDESNRAVYANPDGWKKLYRDVVYPKIKASIVTTNKMSEKERLKSEANLIDKPGGAPNSKKAEDETPETSYEAYLKARSKILA